MHRLCGAARGGNSSAHLGEFGLVLPVALVAALREVMRRESWLCRFVALFLSGSGVQDVCQKVETCGGGGDRAGFGG